MITVRQNGEVYEVSFPYDPTVVSIVRNIYGRHWNASQKFWTIPKESLGFLLNEFKGSPYESSVHVISDEDININQNLNSTVEIPDIDISKIPFYVKKGAQPYQHQLDFMKWAIDRQQHGNMGGFILGDTMGLGKTVEATNLAIYNRKQYDFKHCLIICCVNSAKYNWVQDIIEHTCHAETPYILGSRKRKNGSIRCDTGGAEKYLDLKLGKMYGQEDGEALPYFLILNIEALRYKVGKFHVLSDIIIDMISNQQINMIVLDEIHKNASPTSQQGKELLKIKKSTGCAAMWIPMTGTPITKQPTDVFTPLKLCNGHSFNSYYMWCKEFCVYGGFGGYEIVGYKNISKLKGLLESNLIRRLKEDVLDLPPKLRYTEYVENTPYQQKLYSQIEHDIIVHKDDVMVSPNPMTKFLRLRQVNGSPELVDPNLTVSGDYIKYNAKLKRLLELLEDAAERGEKTVVFSNWVEPLRTLYKFVSQRYKTCAFTGTMSPSDRERHKQLFVNDPNYTVLLGTIGAAGVGQTFTSARNLIFYDDPWNPSDKEQAEDRIYRIGTTQSVNIFTLVTKDTVDDRVEQILYTKEGIAKYIVDNQLDLRKNPQLFDFLIGGKS